MPVSVSWSRRQTALAVIFSRREWIGLLLDAIGQKQFAARGVDPARQKLSTARSASRSDLAVRFVRGDARANPVSGPCQAILLIDVLYLLSRAQQERALRDCYARLAPGGVLLIKTMDYKPRWKAALNQAEEWLAVRLLALTLADRGSFAFRSLAEWATLCVTIGFRVETVRLDRGYYHPHVAVVGVRR